MPKGFTTKGYANTEDLESKKIRISQELVDVSLAALMCYLTTWYKLS